MKGQEFSSDTSVRWNTIECVAKKLGLAINPRLVVQLERDSPSPQGGYLATKKLLASGEKFSALFALNDI